MATPRVAAGALFFDEAGRVLLVKPAYKDGWDIPGGHVEPGESPRAACIRERKEEIGLDAEVGPHLVIDWAPADNEGDKLLFIFDGEILSKDAQTRIRFLDGELLEWRFVTYEELDPHLSRRLSRRIRTAIQAKELGTPVYAERGSSPDPTLPM